MINNNEKSEYELELKKNILLEFICLSKHFKNLSNLFYELSEHFNEEQINNNNINENIDNLNNN